MKQLKAKIISNKKVAAGYYKMVIESPYLAKNIKPGQFIKAQVSDRDGPLLRRPFSVHRILDKDVEVMYEVVGRGTEILSRRRPGEELDVLGPLGNGFASLHVGQLPGLNRQTGKPANRQTILVAGGIGVAPLLAWAEELAGERVGELAGLEVLIGARTKSLILCEKDFKKLGANIIVSTDDGSRGKCGYITDCLENLLRVTSDESRATIYACGPHVMLSKVAAIASEYDIPCQVSLEERMACGMGVCLGCPVRVGGFAGERVGGSQPVNPLTHSPINFKMVCKDGPVFDAREIIW